MDNNMSCAERMDLMNSRIAIGLLMASFNYGLDALSYLLTDGDNQLLNWLSLSVSMLAVIWILWAVGPSLLRKLKSRSFNHHEPESFITETLHKAIIKSWVFTMAGLMLLKVLDNVITRAGLPVNFYLNGLVFIMLFSVSVTFLVMTQFSDDDDQEGLAK